MNWISVTDKIPDKGNFLVVVNNGGKYFITICDRVSAFTQKSVAWRFMDSRQPVLDEDNKNGEHIPYWSELPEVPVHIRKCKDCDACHFVRKERYECWGVKEPFEIKDINQYCTEY